MIDPQDITALILAGGRGSRMGGVDKGLQPFGGLPLAMVTLARLQLGGGVGTVLINANRNLAAYESFGVPVWPDALPDFAGPLAGFLTGLEHCETPYLLTVPCDVPRFPLDLAQRLAQGLCDQDAELAMALAPEPDADGQLRLRPQPVFCLLRRELLESLVRFTQGGGRKIDAWTGQHRCAEVAFNAPGDDPLAFANANTLDDLRRLEGHTA
ncbi:MAG: molybdenum cofactor guanylyltransferase MobA [Rhodoferax sp.]